MLVTDHNVKNLFDITDEAMFLDQTVIAEGTSTELLRSSRAINTILDLNFLKN